MESERRKTTTTEGKEKGRTEQTRPSIKILTVRTEGML
jgi:hypothetical protein